MVLMTILTAFAAVCFAILSIHFESEGRNFDRNVFIALAFVFTIIFIIIGVKYKTMSRVEKLQRDLVSIVDDLQDKRVFCKNLTERYQPSCQIELRGLELDSIKIQIKLDQAIMDEMSKLKDSLNNNYKPITGGI